MEIEQLRTFVAILEHSGFSRAAEVMGLTQSTVSFHLKALERAAGARLLNRTSRGISLTAAGKVLRRYASRIVTLRDEALAHLLAEDGTVGGKVRVAASTIAGEFLLPPILSEFRRARPGVDVAIHVADSQAAIASLVNGESDLAVVGAKSREKATTSIPFFQDDVILVGPVPNPFAPDGRLPESRLRDIPLILREEGSGTRAAIDKILARNGLANPDRRAVIRMTGSTAAMRRCVLQGLGLAFISRLAVQEEIAARKLAPVSLPGLPIRRTFHVVRLRGASPPPAVRALVEVIMRRSAERALRDHAAATQAAPPKVAR